MKEHLIFNDQSLPFQTQKTIDDKFPVFLTIIETALKNGFKTIRFSKSMDEGWFQMQLDETTTLNNWLETQSNDYRIKIKSFIHKTVSSLSLDDLPELQERFELSEFCLTKDKSVTTEALGASYYYEQLAISCFSDDCWNESKLNISITELTDKGKKTFSSDVKNCTTLAHWNEHFIIIDKERKENLQKGKHFWVKKEFQFPNLIFCKETEKQLTNLSISDGLYNQLWRNLTALNKYCDSEKASYTLEDLKSTTGFKITDESDSVKQNKALRRKREFRIDGKRAFFGYHIKNFSSSFRMHIYLHKGKSKLFIGYFGEHLPTKKFK